MSSSDAPEFDFSDESLNANLSQGFHLLRAERRRHVIWFVLRLDSEEEITVREVAKQITAIEQDLPRQEVNNRDYRSVYTSLVQLHLPALDAAGVVGFDKNRKRVSGGPNALAMGMLAFVAIGPMRLLLNEDLE